ncbi:MAG: hypothetical protein CL983_02715 [Euryarchaeota archaeon]|nr:hypothetical protein [Euryarchaeota archaeon]|tara:strand:- start:9698 stop:10534 length:837 start_codon:yes stop_codon:yes gene_type:complete
MRQNPNMIRTLLLLSFTLIFLLAYAVYGASSNSGYYVYESEQNSTSPELSAIGTNPIYQNGKTVWIWEFETNTNNLTWINVSVEGGVENSILKVINIDGNFWSHPELGDALNTDTNCADRIKKDGEYVWVTIDCQVGSTHTMSLENGNGNFISLSHPDPALRDGGTVRSDDYESGLAEVNSIFNRTHESKSWQISIEVEGDHTEVNPSVEVSYVNEKIISVELFKIDAVTEMLWSMAALIGCFMILLVPAFLVYFISQNSTRNERKELELALEQDKIS